MPRKEHRTLSKEVVELDFTPCPREDGSGDYQYKAFANIGGVTNVWYTRRDAEKKIRKNLQFKCICREQRITSRRGSGRCLINVHIVGFVPHYNQRIDVDIISLDKKRVGFHRNGGCVNYFEFSDEDLQNINTNKVMVRVLNLKKRTESKSSGDKTITSVYRCQLCESSHADIRPGATKSLNVS
jgi:predicted SprT family Zn-dependent metalloprotease